MKLQHQTEVTAEPRQVWEFLQDTHAVARCLPGAELVDDLGGDRYQGLLRVAVGPLKMTYAGDVEVVERSVDEHRIVLDARGRDKRGSGSVQAHVRLQVQPAEPGTRLEVVSDVQLTGRIASLGRGVRDVSNRMFVQFADQLADRIEQGPDQAPAATSTDSTTTTTTSEVREQDGSATRAATAGQPPGAAAGEIKVVPLVWTITRQRFADFLERLSRRIRPR